MWAWHSLQFPAGPHHFRLHKTKSRGPGNEAGGGMFIPKLIRVRGYFTHILICPGGKSPKVITSRVGNEF